MILFVLIGSASATNDNITILSQDTDNNIIQEKISTENSDSSLKEILKTNVSGNTFADIQTALDSAESGDTIELLPLLTFFSENNFEVFIKDSLYLN